MVRREWASSVLTVLLLLLNGCSQREYKLFQEGNVTESVTTVSDAEYKDEMVFENRIRPNDRVSIMVYNQTGPASGQMASMVQSRGGGSGGPQVGDEGLGLLVTQRGTVRLPLIGTKTISGLTEDEAAEMLILEYSKYLRNPYVTVEIMNQRIFVIGEVKSPGVIPVTNGTMNIVEAIARSGDLTDYAERTNIKILRGDLRKPEVRIIDLTQMSAVTVSSLFLRPNDVVYVQPRAMKGYNMALQEIAPPFQLISTMLQPFVNIRYLTK